MKKRMLIFALLWMVLCLGVAVNASAAVTIEGYESLVFQIGLPTEIPAEGGFCSVGAVFSRSDEPVSTLSWTTVPMDGGPALQITAEGTGKDSKRAVLNMDPNVEYQAGGPYRYTVQTTLNDFVVTREVSVVFVDQLPESSYSVTAAKITGPSAIDAPVSLQDGVMSMERNSVYALTETAATNSVFYAYTLNNPDNINNEWEEDYSWNYPDLNLDQSCQQIYKAKIAGSYSHSFTASYYARYQGSDSGTNLGLYMPYTLEITDAAAVKRTISFDMNEGTVAFDVAWPGYGDGNYPPAWPMEDVQVNDGKSYTVPECTIIPPDWKMFDHWQAQSVSGTQNYKPGDVVTVTEDMLFIPVWVNRTFSAAFEIGTLTQGVDDPPSFFVHNFLIPYIPADMVPYTARGNKTPYDPNIEIFWYAVQDGGRGELVSKGVSRSPSEAAPGGAYFQTMAPGEVGDYELVITYKGTEVLTQQWSMVEGIPQGGHSYALTGSLDKEWDGIPVDFDPDKMLEIDKGMTRWAVLEKNEEARFAWRMLEGKEYTEMDNPPADAGQYQLVIQEQGGKGWEDAAVFDFEITGSASSGPVVLSENLELRDVSTRMLSNGQLEITGTVSAPSEVVRVRIAGWKDEEQTADMAREYAEFMTSVWKRNESSLTGAALPFSFSGSRPVAEDDLGKTQYTILAGLDKNVNLVGFAVIKVKNQKPQPKLTLSVSPEKPVLGQPVTVSWNIASDSYELGGLFGNVYIGDMLKHINFQDADVTNNSSGSIELTFDEGQDLELCLWTNDDEIWEVYHFSGATGNPDPIQVNVAYQKAKVATGEKITADYAITGGSGEYESINAYWGWMNEGYEERRLQERMLDSTSGRMEYTPAQAGKVGLVFEIEDRTGWLLQQFIFSVPTVTVTGNTVKAAPGISFYEGLPVSVDPLTESSLLLTWDVTGGGDYLLERSTRIHVETDDGQVLEDAEVSGSATYFHSIDLYPARLLNTRNITISLTPGVGSTWGKKVTKAIPVRMIKLVLPRSLTAIEAEAFLNTAARIIDIPDGVTSIGSNAFPTGATLIVGSGTPAEIWANENGYTTIIR